MPGANAYPHSYRRSAIPRTDRVTSSCALVKIKFWNSLPSPSVFRESSCFFDTDGPKGKKRTSTTTDPRRADKASYRYSFRTTDEQSLGGGFESTCARTD